MSTWGLLVLNLVLQVCDGVLTYIGVTHGISEANRLVARAFPLLGIAGALMFYKGLSCLMLVGITRIAPPVLARIALTFFACVLSAVVCLWIVSLATIDV